MSRLISRARLVPGGQTRLLQCRQGAARGALSSPRANAGNEFHRHKLGEIRSTHKGQETSTSIGRKAAPEEEGRPNGKSVRAAQTAQAKSEMGKGKKGKTVEGPWAKVATAVVSSARGTGSSGGKSKRESHVMQFSASVMPANLPPPFVVAAVCSFLGFPPLSSFLPFEPFESLFPRPPRCASMHHGLWRMQPQRHICCVRGSVWPKQRIAISNLEMTAGCAGHERSSLSDVVLRTLHLEIRYAIAATSASWSPPLRPRQRTRNGKVQRAKERTALASRNSDLHF